MADYITLDQLQQGNKAYFTLTDLQKMQPAEAPSSGFDPLGYIKNDLQAIPGRLGNIVAGGVKGASNLGATLLTPVDAAARALGVQNDFIGRDDRRQQVTDALVSKGADPNSLQFKAGELGTEVLGTMGVGGALAAPVRALTSLAPRVAPAIAAGLESGGFSVPGLSGAPALLARTATGAATGGASAGLIDPNMAGEGALIGGALPGGVQMAGRAGQWAGDTMKDVARSLMQTSVKPTIKQLKSGDAATAIETMLQNGISPNEKGVERLQSLIDGADNRITQGVANSTATIDKANTLGPVLQTRAQFGSQVSPVSDLNAIDGSIAGYLNHPTYPGMNLSVQDAQAMKQGTYRVLAKKYGQMGSADTEAQKSLARGLKDEIANAVPGVADANADLSKFLTTLDVAQRRALMAGNNNPMGLAALAPTKANLLAFLADRSTALKALTARGLYSAAPTGNVGLLNNFLQIPGVRTGLLATEASP